MNSARTDSIAALRARMEQLDEELVTLMARRQDIAQQLAAAKEAAGLPVVDLAREADVLRRASALAHASDLDEEVVRHIFWCLIDLSRRAQLGTSA